MSDIQFPNESEDYRRARNELLDHEKALRKNIEQVAELRRNLPVGGVIKNDYEFEELSANQSVQQIKFSELFQSNKNSLVIYSFMYGPDMAEPCPSCTSILDGLNGISPHVTDRLNFVVIAKSPIHRIVDWAKIRGWNHLRLLSSAKNSYNGDYYAENENGDQLPATNVFIKKEHEIFHSYNTELLYSSCEKDQEPRHVDLLWPIWSMFDLIPEGRGQEWHPKLSYK